MEYRRIFYQILLVFAVWAVAEWLRRISGFPLSSGILGLLLMLALLFGRVLKVEMVAAGSKWLLGELVFFFIPIMVSVLQYRQLLAAQGWRIVLTIVVGTALVMISTALTLHYCNRLRRQLHHSRRRNAS